MISDIRIPSRFPAATFGAILLWLAGSFGIGALWYRTLPPLEVYYLPTYAKSLIPEIHLHPGWHLQRYLVPHVGFVMATEATLATAQPGQLSVKPLMVPKWWFDHWLRGSIYHGDTFPELLIRPGIASGILLLFCLWLALPIDMKRRRLRRDGVRLRGPEMLTVKQFNQRVKGDGLEFKLRRGSK